MSVAAPGTATQNAGEAGRTGFFSVLGSGAMINWITVDRSDETLFSDWYDYQHLRERVSTPGFLRGRRFRAVDQPDDLRLDYLTVYETENTEVLASPEYLRRLDNPTELTQRVVPLFREFRRATCTTTVVRGDGSSARLVAVDLDVAADAAAIRETLAARFDQLIGEHLALAASLYEPDQAVAAAKDSTSEGRSTQQQQAESLTALVELHAGTDAFSVAGQLLEALERAGLSASQPRPAREFEFLFELRSH